MRTTNKIVLWASLLLATLSAVSSLAGIYTVSHPATGAAEPAPIDNSVNSAAIVSDLYDSSGADDGHFGSYQCNAVIHNPTSLVGLPAGTPAQGGLSEVPPWNVTTAVPTGNAANTLSAAKTGRQLISITFSGAGNSAWNSYCATSLEFAQSIGTGESGAFYGGWQTGRNIGINKTAVAYIAGHVDYLAKTITFTLPSVIKGVNDTPGLPPLERAGSFTMNLTGDLGVLSNPAYFPTGSSDSGAGSTSTALDSCFENAADFNSISACVTAAVPPIFDSVNSISYAGDTYVATQWGGGSTMTYTLTTPGDPLRLNSGKRPTLVLSTDPDTNNGLDLNIDHGSDNSADLRQFADALTPGKKVTLTLTNYDKSGNSTIANIKNVSTAGINTFATYYPSADRVNLLFSNASSNEQPFVGNYVRSDATHFQLTGGGYPDCAKNLPNFNFLSDPKAASSTYDGIVSAILYLPANDGTCGYTPANVKVIIADAHATAPDAGSPASSSPTSGTSPEINCSISFFNPLSWFLCPLASALELVVTGLDDQINSYLDINVTDVKASYGSSCEGLGGNDFKWCSYYQSWSIVRNIALGLMAVFTLIAIVSQALGFEIFDAYTIRKVLPRLLVTAIGIALSWPLMMFFINLTDALGFGVRQLIYAPFSGLKVQLGGGGQFVASFFGAGAILALGFAGLLSFVATAALAAAVAFLVLTLRQMLIVMLVIFAPIAIACYILPGTQKVWHLWWESFSKGLLMFPIIAAFIALGRVFAAVNSQNTGSINQIISFTAYFAPYFLIPFTFRLAGGAISTIGGLANDRSKGAFDRLKKFRGNEMSRNMRDLKAGSRFNPQSKLTRALGGNAVNRVGSNVGAGVRGRFGFGGTGAAARANNATLTMDGAARENAAFAAQMNNEGAMAALAFGNNEAELRKLKHYQKSDGSGVDEEKLKADMDAARSIGIDRRTQVAAAEALAKSGKVISNRDEAESLYNTVSGGNAALRSGVKGNYQFTSRQVGRADIGRDTDRAALRELNVSDFSRQKPKSLENLLGAGATPGSPAVPPADTPIVSAMAESVASGNYVEANHYADILHAAQSSPYTTPEQQEQVQKAVEYVNGMTGPNGQPLRIMDGAATRAQQKLGRDVDGTTGQPRGMPPPG